jgi:hypothetical protein
LKADDLYDRILEAAPDVEKKFLELGSLLWRLMDIDRVLFWQAVDKTGLGKRKAYYLIAIAKAFKNLKFSRPRLRAIGWTRLQVIARAVNESNAEELVNLAEQHKVKDLEAIIKGEEPQPDSRVVILYLTPEEYEHFEKVVVHHGASRHGRGLVSKEKALMKALAAKPVGPKAVEKKSA